MDASSVCAFTLLLGVSWTHAWIPAPNLHGLMHATKHTHPAEEPLVSGESPSPHRPRTSVFSVPAAIQDAIEARRNAMQVEGGIPIGSFKAIARHLDEEAHPRLKAALPLLHGSRAAVQLASRSLAERLAEATNDADIAMATLLMQPLLDGSISSTDVYTSCGASVALLTDHCARMIELQRDSRDLLWSDPSTSGLSPEQAANFQNMLITMASDWRVVTLILANHATHLASLTVPFRGDESYDPVAHRDAYIAARDSLDVYAPLAHRLGMHQLKSEIEGAAFEYLYPKEHALIRHELDERFSTHQIVLDEQIKVLKRALCEDPLFMNNIARVSVEGRSKEPYSIWRKIAGLPGGITSDAVAEVLDRLALRVVFEVDDTDVADASLVRQRGQDLCYHVLDLVHDQWPFMQVRVKDYIKSPKPNGYQSLHTTARTRHHGLEWPFEVQIRTEEMHRVAEWGRAAHVDYKAESNLEWALFPCEDAPGTREARPQDVMPVDLDAQAMTFTNPREYAVWLHETLSGNRVFVFIDNKICDLARGMTLQQALQRLNMVATIPIKKLKINGALASPDYQLRNGDTVQFA